MNATNILKKVKDFLKPQFALIIAAAFLVISIFIPIMKADEETEETFRFRMEMYEDMDMDDYAKEYENVLKASTTSLFTASLNVLTKGSNLLGESVMFILPSTGLILLLVALTALLAIFKKSVGVVIVSVLNFIVLLVEKYLFNETFMESGFEWAFGNGFMFFAVILVAVVAIWNIVERKKSKKAELAE